ncbi:hypothetical protein DFH09DRAFT_1094093 [Mycena vulgaris]|nr:hypothetical protein DFH09DRAFT_1094093 [Mycena vulgaris]
MRRGALAVLMYFCGKVRLADLRIIVEYAHLEVLRLDKGRVRGGADTAVSKTRGPDDDESNDDDRMTTQGKGEARTTVAIARHAEGGDASLLEGRDDDARPSFLADKIFYSRSNTEEDIYIL